MYHYSKICGPSEEHEGRLSHYEEKDVLKYAHSPDFLMSYSSLSKVFVSCCLNDGPLQ